MKNIIDNYCNFVESSIDNATKHKSKITLESGVLDIEGMSSQKVRHLLNNLCSMQDARYLEIGVWKGSTFISSLYDNLHVSATCVENFSEFDAAGNPLTQYSSNNVELNGSRNEFLNNTKKYSELKKIPEFIFIENDSFKLDVKTIDKKNIYFYDGRHQENDQMNAFTYYNDILDDVFICIVDDWNYADVRSGTEKAFKTLNYKVCYEKKLIGNYVGKRQYDTKLWWNGLYVAVISKQ